MSSSPKPRRQRIPEAALADAPVACLEIDLDGKLVWVNAEGCRLLGRSESELLGRQVWELEAPEEQESSRQAMARHLGAEGPPGCFERTLVRSDGARVVVEMHENQVRDKAGAIIGIRTFLIDLTERKHAEEALRKAAEGLEFRVRERNRELELATGFLRREMEERRSAEAEHRKLESQMQLRQRLESMGALAGGVAHEFNNLLTSMMGYASLAMMDLPVESSARKNINYVLAAAQSAAVLARQMLAYSGRGKFVVERMDLSKLVEGMARLLQSGIRKKTTLHFHLAPALPPLEADSGQMRQLVMNLFSNATEAVEEGGGEIAVSTGITWAESGELPPLEAGSVLGAGLYIYLEVRDTGSGMDAATLQKIFDPFFTTKADGRGLGLTAVQGIVRGHRGSIQVSSQLGEGSVFRVLFPAEADWMDSEP